jgi:hypothetical protein
MNTRRFSVRLVLVSSIVGALLGCGSSSDTSTPGSSSSNLNDCSGYCSKCGSGKANCVDECTAASSVAGGQCAAAWNAAMSCAMLNECGTNTSACDMLNSTYARCLISAQDGGMGGSAGSTGGAAGASGSAAGAAGSAPCASPDSACVACGSSTCHAGETCCGSSCTTAGSCQEKINASCDGAEDCSGKRCCVSMHFSDQGVVSSEAACNSTCKAQDASSNDYIARGPACHAQSECAGVKDDYGVPYSECCKGPGSPISVCMSQTFASEIKKSGGDCNTGKAGSSTGGSGGSPSGGCGAGKKCCAFGDGDGHDGYCAADSCSTIPSDAKQCTANGSTSVPCETGEVCAARSDTLGVCLTSDGKAPSGSASCYYDSDCASGKYCVGASYTSEGGCAWYCDPPTGCSDPSDTPAWDSHGVCMCLASCTVP